MVAAARATVHEDEEVMVDLSLGLMPIDFADDHAWVRWLLCCHCHSLPQDIACIVSSHQIYGIEPLKMHLWASLPCTLNTWASRLLLSTS